ncbi:MAG: sodium-dependent transporter [Pseudomonadota bacterium]
MAGSRDISRKAETWGSKFGFIMAAVGSSVGLGNFWRFPYTAGENGGGAFILAYLICVLIIGLPLLMAEYSIGRKSGLSATEGVQYVARSEGRSENWAITGWVGSMAAFFILSFYNVISAWLIAFIPQAFSGDFAGFAADAARQTAEAQALDPNAKEVSIADVSGANFGATIGDTGLIISLLFVFIAANAFIVGRGVKAGIERVATILMPLFFLMLLGVVVFAVTIGDFAKTAAFIFEPKWSDVGFKTFLAALGQAFFSLGVGVGLMITYGAYLSKDTDITRSSGIIAGSDTMVALIAGFAIFPIVFAFGGSVAAGPGLFFVSMPVAFGAMDAGALFGGVFFTLALFAAFTSSISLMEVGVSWLEERHGVTRQGAAAGYGFVLFMIGVAYVFSLEYLDFMDFMTEGLLLPLGGLLMAVFAGWVASRKMLTSELGDGRVMDVWRFAVRWVAPIFVSIVLVFGFLDKLQDIYGLQLPGLLTPLLGPNS